MSAAEKLRALSESDAFSEAEDLIMAALPQIVAVVEAAERQAAKHDQEFMDDAGIGDVPPWQGFANLHSALAALEQELTNPQGKD